MEMEKRQMHLRLPRFHATFLLNSFRIVMKFGICLYCSQILIRQHLNKVRLFLATTHTIFVFTARRPVECGACFTPLYRRIWEDPALWIPYSFSISITLASVVCLIAIFLYSNRPFQANVVKGSVILQLIALGLAVGVFFSLGGFGMFLWEEAVGLLLMGLSLIAQFLAIRGINKDEELVRSMDRIR